VTLFYHTRKAIQLNKQNFDHIEGTRIYPRKTANIIIVALLISIAGLLIYVLGSQKHGISTELGIVLATVVIIIGIPPNVPLIVLNQPIAIVNEEGVYYVLEEELYTYDDYKIQNVPHYKYPYTVFEIRDYRNYAVVRHAHWTLKNVYNFESRLNYYLILRKRKKAGFDN